MNSINRLILGIVGVMSGILAVLLLINAAENKIKNDFISYEYLYEHNISYEQVPTKQYAKYILKRKYNESLKSLEKLEKGE